MKLQLGAKKAERMDKGRKFFFNRGPRSLFYEVQDERNIDGSAPVSFHLYLKNCSFLSM